MPTVKLKTKYTVGSLFAGVGGICQAFKNSNCEILWANELDGNSRKTYTLNHKTTNLTDKNDIKDLLAEDVEAVDILTAGFPCQPFSVAGHGQGFDDDRGKVFFEIIRLLKELRPRAYFLENVKSLSTHNNGKSFQLVREAIEKTGYSFIPFVLNAAEFSEIPQGRERIYIVGFRDEGHFSHPRPVKENILSTGSESPFSSSFRIPEKFDGHSNGFTRYLEKSSVKNEDYYNDETNIIHVRVREAVREPDKFYQYRRWYVRENKSGVCPTLTANMGAGGHNIPIILDGDTPRRLTPKECFNLQGFPLNFVLPTDVPRGHLYKQAGNTVVVPMVGRIATEIVRVLDENGNR